MPRAYTVNFSAVSVSAAQDLFELTPADDKPIAIYGIFVSQNSDYGDAQDEGLRYSVIRGFTTSGSGGGTPTPAPVSPADAAAGFTAETNNTTLANTGTTTQPHSDVFNVRTGLQLWLPPEAWIWASQANTTVVVRIPAPADQFLTGMDGTIYVLEYP